LEVLLEGRTFDLLFTDVVMSDGMNGYQLAAFAQRAQPGLKVVFTTGYFRPEPGKEPLGSTAGVTLRKPFRRQELALTVRAALEG
jgi:CheY-like chemotaxis protein